MMIQARVFNTQNMCDGSNSYQYENLKTGELLLDKNLMLVMLENQAKLTVQKKKKTNNWHSFHVQCSAG